MSYKDLSEELAKINHLCNINKLANWDAATGLPSGSAASRNMELASFATVIHEMSTSEKLSNLIKDASKDVDILDEWDKKNLELAHRNHFNETCVPNKLQHELSLATSECELNWREARKNNDYNSLIPHLDKVFSYVKEYAEVKSSKLGKSKLDVLIDSYDKGRTSAEIDPVFEKLKKELPDLISKIIDKQSREKIIPINVKIKEEDQKAIGLRIIEKMGFDLSRGRLDKSAHPFCSGSNDDVRMTTRYDEDNFLSGLFGIIHETGHGLYQQNLPEKYRDQPVGQPHGMSFHESQSLFMEMQASISLEFMDYLSKLLKDELGLSGPEFAGSNLYNSVTRVQSSFIRVEADEVTYPLHVILRYEIEKEILFNDLKAKDIPALWAEKMKKFLGITPPTDSQGCMQDIHWPAGFIGYFPCYTNGAIIASMVMKNAKSKNPNIKNDLRTGNFSKLNEFLNKNLRNFGSLYNSDELLKAASGEAKINADIYLDYLKAKYL